MRPKKLFNKVLSRSKLSSSRFSIVQLVVFAIAFGIIGGLILIITKAETPGDLLQWKTNANSLPATRTNLSSVTANGYVYTIGGWGDGGTQSTVYYAKFNADGSTGAWTTSINPLPEARRDHSTVTSNGYVYAIGGYSSSDTATSTVYYAKFNADGSTGAWTTSINPLPEARAGHSSVVASDYVYVIGGMSGGYKSTVLYAKLDADGSTGTWQTSANALPTSLAYHSSAFANGYVYAIGGFSGSDHQSTVYYAKLDADGSTGTWATTNAMPAARSWGSALTANGYIYEFAGYDTHNGLSQLYHNTIFYAKLNADGSVEAWQTSGNTLPVAVAFHSSVSANGYFYVIGGSDSSNFRSSVYYTSPNNFTPPPATNPPPTLSRTISFDIDDDVVVPFVNDDSRGLIWDDIKPGTGACVDSFQIEDDQGNQLGCTHGPDPAGPEMITDPSDESGQTLGATTDTSESNIGCIGDGVSGFRVQMLYAHAADKPDRYAQLADKLQQYAANMNSIMLSSSNNSRSIRFVTTADCRVSVPDVMLSQTGDDSFPKAEKELLAQGYNQPNRKYMVWIDKKTCGMADFVPDSNPGQDNASNGSAPEFGWVGLMPVDVSPPQVPVLCAGGAGEAHELMHTLGAVQEKAPHSSGREHCNDGLDVMCYNDGGPTTSYTTKACPDKANENIYDCHKDDYFNASPKIPRDNYLYDHWNAANSRFLIGSQTSNLPSPTNFTATTTSANQINLAWSASAGASQYAITRNGVAITKVDGSVTTYSDTGLSPSTSYSYSMMAIDADGYYSVATSLATAITTNGGLADSTKPATPTNLTADVVSPTKVNLSWPASTDNVAVTSYDVYRSNTKIATIASSVFTDPASNIVYFGDVSTQARTSYTYWVQASDAAGNQSAVSEKISVTTPAVSSGLGSLTGTATNINGQPLPSVKVSYTLNGTTKSVTTNASGKYAISSLPAGKRSFNITYLGYRAKTITAKVVADGNQRVNFNLRKLGAISGTVTDSASGKPLSSAVVSYKLNSVSKTVKTNASGKYTILNLPAEIKISGTNYAITYSLRGYQSKDLTVAVHLDQTKTRNVGLAKL